MQMTTTQRGYGHRHNLARKAALQRLRDGDPCAQCLHGQGIHHPMFRAAAKLLDLSHTRDRRGYLGLSYRRCNRSEGAIRGNVKRGQLKHGKPRASSRIW